jgi:hypothetical protein
MNIGIEKISNDFIPSLPYPLEGINSAIGTADVEEDPHLTRGPNRAFLLQIVNHYLIKDSQI